MASNEDDVRAGLLAKLRAVHPVKVRVYDAADEVREIAVPTRRTRWAQVIENIEARAWVRVELCNKDGAVLAYVMNEDQGDDPKAAAPEAQSSAREERLLAMMLKAQEIALKYRDQEHRALLTSMAEMLKVNVDATRQLQSIYAAQVDAAAEVASLRAQAEAGGDFDMSDILKAAPQLMPLLGVLFRKKAIAAPAVNGAG